MFSEDDALEEILENLADGLDDEDAVMEENGLVNVRGGVLPEEQDAVDALITLGGCNVFTEE